MKRVFKIVIWTACTLAVLGVVAIGSLYYYVTSDSFRTMVESRAGGVTGRKTKIAKIVVDWGSTTRVRLDDVAVANADWGKAEHMLKAEQVDFDIRLWPLLRGNIVLPRFTLRKPEIYIERNDKDALNLSSEESPVVVGAAKAAAPTERHQIPLIGRLEITDGRIGYQDAKRKLELDGAISTASGKAGAQPEAELSVKGKLEGQPLSVHFMGGSALMLRETEQPYPVDLDIAYGATRLGVKGTLQDPIQWKGASVELTLSGPNLSEIYPLLGIPGPPTPPYRIAGKLDHEPGTWKLVDSKWHVGDSDLSGDILIDQRQKPEHLTAKLVSQNLAFADLAPLVGATPGKRGNVSPQQRQTEQRLEAKGELFPDVPLHIERLRAMNMDVSLDAKRVVAPPYLPVQALAFRVVIDNGRATVKPLTLAIVGGGSVSGEMGIDARTDTPAVRALLSARGIDIGTFFRGSRYFDTTHGKVQGRIQLAGSGRSLAKVMGSANGYVDLAMAGGSVSSLMVSLAGLQIADALILYIAGDNRIPIGCALGRLAFNQGTATFDHTLLDTTKSVLHVDGTVSLSTQAVNVKVSADPKKFDLLDLHGPVVVAGKIRSPAVSLGRVIPIPTPVIGDAKDVQCEAMTRQLLARP